MLDLKYRPMAFDALVGQPMVARVLSQGILRGASRHVVLFGPTGTGKTSAARLYGRALNCLTPTAAGSPCNDCESCRDILAGAHPDHIEVDSASAGGKAEIARLLEVAKAPPMVGRYRVLQLEECFSYDTLVELEDGRREPIGKIVTQKLPVSVLSYNERTGDFEPKKVVNWIRAPQDRWTDLWIAGGRSHDFRLRCSELHTHYTTRGLVQTKDLDEDDCLLQRQEELTWVQKSLLAASVVGDGSRGLSTSGKTRLFVRHAGSQLDYLEFKRRLWGDLAGEIGSKSRSGVTGDPVFTFEVCNTEALTERLNLYSGNSNGRVTYKQLDQVDFSDFNELSLFLWIIDNGGAKNCRRWAGTVQVSLRSRFTRAEVDHFASFLKERFGIRATGASYKGGTDNRIFMRAQEVAPIIRPFLADIPTIRRKLDGMFDETVWGGAREIALPRPKQALVARKISRIQRDIRLEDPTYKFRYCLEVEDNHNFFVQRRVLTHNCQDLSKEAWDTLLLILEEPPPHLVFIFTTTQRRKVPTEVAQRCFELETKLLSPSDALAYLTRICEAEGLVYEPAALKLISFLGQGHVRGLLAKLEQVTWCGDVTLDAVREMFGLGYIPELLGVWSGLAGGGVQKAMDALFRWNAPAPEILEICREFLLHMQGKFVFHASLTVNPVLDTIPDADLRRIMALLTDRASDSGVDVVDVYGVLNKVLASATAPTDLALRLLVCDLHTLINRHGCDPAKLGRPAQEPVKVAGAQQGKKVAGRRFASAYLVADERGVVCSTPSTAPVPQPLPPPPAYAPAPAAAGAMGFFQPAPPPLYSAPPAPPPPSAHVSVVSMTPAASAATDGGDVEEGEEDAAPTYVPARMLRGELIL